MTEAELYREILAERKHVSALTGKNLTQEVREFNVCIFAHVLPKGGYPRFKLRKDNIILLTPFEHFLLDYGTEQAREEYARLNHCTWKPIYELRETLKALYYAETKVRRFN